MREKDYSLITKFLEVNFFYRCLKNSMDFDVIALLANEYFNLTLID